MGLHCAQYGHDLLPEDYSSVDVTACKADPVCKLGTFDVNNQPKQGCFQQNVSSACEVYGAKNLGHCDSQSVVTDADAAEETGRLGLDTRGLLAVAGAAITTLCGGAIWHFYKKRKAAKEERARTIGVDRTATDADVGPDSDDPSQNKKCMICLEDFEAGHVIRQLPCDGRHDKFHAECIEEWNEVSGDKNCPKCRQEYR